jgi:hypothetical protein
MSPNSAAPPPLLAPGQHGDVTTPPAVCILIDLQDHLDRPYKVLRHKVGSSSAEDPVVYEEKDEVR